MTLKGDLLDCIEVCISDFYCDPNGREVEWMGLLWWTNIPVLFAEYFKQALKRNLKEQKGILPIQ